MGDWVKVKASDGHELSAYVARPNGQEVGGLVIVQEIFGVNKSIRAVADSYAQDGFVVIAPAIMDRIEPNLDLGYGEADLKKAFSLYPKLNPDDSVKDVAAAFKHISGGGKATGRPRLLLRRAHQLALRHTPQKAWHAIQPAPSATTPAASANLLPKSPPAR